MEIKSVAAALRILKGRGYKIQKTKLYDDVKNGILPVQLDKSILEEDLNEYAKKNLDFVDKENNVAASGEKLAWDARKSKAQAEKLEYELDVMKGKYIPKKDFTRELVSRAAVLESDFKYFVKTSVPEWITIVDGKQEKSEMLLKTIMEQFDLFLNDFATTKTFNVMVITDDDSDL